MEKLEETPPSFYPDLFTAVQQIWANHFPIQESQDLAFLLGMLLYRMEYFPEALEYLGRSQQLYGDDPSTLYNIAMCYYRLCQLEPALDFIQQTLAIAPDFEAARLKRIQWKAELKQRTP